MSELRKTAEAVLEAWGWDWSEPRNEALRERMEALRQALAMENFSEVNQEIEEALKQTEQKPVAWGFAHRDGGILDIKNADEHEGYEEIYKVPLYTAPPKREWVWLTDEEARDISFNLPIKWTGHLQGAASIYDFARAIEAKLKEKNT